MKTILFVCAITALSLGVGTTRANNGTPAKPVVAGKRFINMQGPSTISLSTGPYGYSVDLHGATLPDNAKWTIEKDGNVVARFSATQVVNGIAMLSVNGTDFGTTGTFYISLTGVTNDGFGMIYGAKSVTATL
ncbi:hypothetical protein [Chitinophaga flava]|uniref:Uncharacterized protein n=1 Tax=Chitinophaga flava TaxID=2259036 RepID=A0A365Y3L9_9BACT|nr:hypothetical protein [Chitinophaga flava]RBL92495.1 hypothetical protein DF182_07900 [Chitinophaga flava]